MTDEKEIKKENIEKNDTPKDKGESEVKEKTEVSENKSTEEKVVDKDVVAESPDEKKDVRKFTPRNDGKRPPFKKNFRKRTPFKREKPEFEQKILSLRRVTRVMAGGRRFSFSVAMVVGDKKGRVGFGMGKSNDTTLAIEKAVRNAKKNMVKVTFTKEGSVPYDVKGKYKSSEIVIRPIFGKGLAAGGAVRTVLEFAGAKEAGAKILTRSKNHINNAKATLEALLPFSEKVEVSLKVVDKKRGFKPRRKFGDKPGSRFGARKPFGAVQSDLKTQFNKEKVKDFKTEKAPEEKTETK